MEWVEFSKMGVVGTTLVCLPSSRWHETARNEEGTHKGCPYGLKFGYGRWGRSSLLEGFRILWTIPVPIVGATLVVALFLAA